MHCKQWFVFYLILMIVCSSVFAGGRETVILKTGWKFHKGHQEAAPQVDFDDSDWEDVRVPHDWAIGGPFIPDGDGNTGKLPWQGEGWYRLRIPISEEEAGNRFYLLFDGVMAFPSVYLNGELAGRWDYGYNSFYLDITDFIRFGQENVLAVSVDTRPHDSRWYPGAGIYRKVSLIKVHPVHVDIWGVYITTPIIKPHYADVRIATEINNNLSEKKDVRIEQAIFSAEGNQVVQGHASRTIREAHSENIEMTLTIPNPRRWDTDDPHLYTVITKVFTDDVLTDSMSSSFGVREMRFTSDYGFYLNDRRVQFKGVNLHHDFGPLGAAFNERAMERQLEMMKAIGCNAVRTSHNTAAPELLDLCDRMGLLVFDEIFDKYDRKADITDTTDFESFAHRNVRNFIKRDRNHPSVFIWSAGNEIGDAQWNNNNGLQQLHTMLNFINKYDPTRPTTMVCDRFKSAEIRHFDLYDVHAWNYGRRYSLARQLAPGKPVIISESASTVSTRGFYELPLPEDKTQFTESFQVSSYDLNAPYWADLADEDFMWQQEEPYVAGEFVWTGFDYLGESTPYDPSSLKQQGKDERVASRSSYFGIVDLCGIPKDRYYLYKSYWKPEETTVHILPHWNWAEHIGENVPVFVYTNGDCAELFLNGKSLGMQCKNPKSENSTERFRLMWKDVIYQPGTLKAVAYRENVKIGEAMMRTAGEPAQIRLSPDRKVIHADGDDLSYILIEALDGEGNACPLADQEIVLQVTGAGRIAGVDNGNPRSLEPFQSDKVKLFYGKAMLILRSGTEPGEIRVNASSKGLQSARAVIRVEE